MDDDYTPDYASCSLRELYDVRARINREEYPRRYALLLAEIERRERDGEVEKFEVKESQISRVWKSRFVSAVLSRFVSAVLMLIGVFTLTTFVIMPAIFTIRSRNWPSVTCTIVYNSNKDAQPPIFYKYQIADTNYTGTRLSSTADSYAGRPSYWRWPYRNGSRTTCFVNPENQL